MASKFDRAALGDAAQFLYRDGINPRDLHKSEALRTLASARLARQGITLALAQEVVEVLAHDYGPEGDIG
jgi:hypothetical protein